MFFISFFDIIYKETFLHRASFGGLRPLFQDTAVIVHNLWFVTWQNQTYRTLNKYKYCDRNVQINTDHRVYQQRLIAFNLINRKKSLGFSEKCGIVVGNMNPG